MSFYTFVSPLGSAMMAPGLPEVATKYGITNSSVLTLTLSIYLVSFAIGVGVISTLSSSMATDVFNGPFFWLLGWASLYPL